MKTIRTVCILLILSIAAGFMAPAAMALDDPQADSTKAIVLVAEKGRDETVLYTKNAEERMYPASLTKIMTVLLAIEAVEAGSVKLTDMVTAQPGFDFDMIIGGSSVYMVTGETMTLENLLYCAMVASANEVCNVIAEYVGGSISAFVEQMNARAAELGSDKAANMVMLGAVIQETGIVKPETVREEMAHMFSGRKEKFLPMNLKALETYLR